MDAGTTTRTLREVQDLALRALLRSEALWSFGAPLIREWLTVRNVSESGFIGDPAWKRIVADAEASIFTTSPAGFGGQFAERKMGRVHRC
jgi:hypothetical protein